MVSSLIIEFILEMERRYNRDKTNRRGETNNGSTHRRVGTGRVRPNSDEHDFSQNHSRYRNYERRNHRNDPNDRHFQPIDSNRNENNSNEIYLKTYFNVQSKAFK